MGNIRWKTYKKESEDAATLRFLSLTVLSMLTGGCLVFLIGMTLSGCGKREKTHTAETDPLPALTALPEGTPTLDWQAFRRIYGDAIGRAVKAGKKSDILKAWGTANRASDPALLKLALAREEKAWPDFEREAETYLLRHRDDLLATEVMERYAADKREADFLRLGAAYGGTDAPFLLSFAEIALHADWPPMIRAFSTQTLQNASESYAQTFRALQLLEACGEWQSVAEALPALETKTVKRYQREDLALMRCRVAIRQNRLGEAERARLQTVAETAMMPDVRREAAELIKKGERGMGNGGEGRGKREKGRGKREKK